MYRFQNWKPKHRSDTKLIQAICTVYKTSKYIIDKLLNNQLVLGCETVDEPHQAK